MNIDTHFRIRLNECFWHRLCTTEEPSQIFVLMYFRVVHHATGPKHRGNQKSIGDFFVSYKFPYFYRVEGAHQNMSKTSVRHHNRWSQRAYMEEWHRIQIPIANTVIA